MLGLVQARGKPLFELVEVLAGKSVPLPPLPTDRKNKRHMMRHLHASYDGLLAFLRAHGAMLASLKSDHLLALDDFLKVSEERHAAAAAAASGGAVLKPERLPRAKRKALEAEHKPAHVEAWLELLLQAIEYMYTYIHIYI